MLKQEINENAIENFISSIDKNLDVYIHYANARVDAKFYKWNMATLNALLRRICKAYANK